MEYRGIQLDESVKLYMKNGEYNKKVKEGLDKFIDRLEKNNHILESKYKNVREKTLINFNCGHESHWITPCQYKAGRGCPKCGIEKASKKNNGKWKKRIFRIY